MAKVPFYIKAGRVIAGIALVLGILRVLLGFAVATGVVVEPVPGYYLGTKTSGKAIDQGIYMILFGVVLGVLSEIGKSLAKKNKSR